MPPRGSDLAVTVTLYLAVDCPDLPAAQRMFQHFIDAGLQADDPRVHVAYGDTMTKEGRQR